jgi:hypothetical protein
MAGPRQNAYYVLVVLTLIGLTAPDVHMSGGPDMGNIKYNITLLEKQGFHRRYDGFTKIRTIYYGHPLPETG